MWQWIASIFASESSKTSFTDKSGKSQSGDLYAPIAFGDQIVNGSKDSIWNLILFTAAAIFITKIVLSSGKSK